MTQPDALDPLALEDAFVALTDGVIVSNAEGRVVSANPAAFRLLGEDQLIGSAFPGPPYSAKKRILSEPGSLFTTVILSKKIPPYSISPLQPAASRTRPPKKCT